MTASLASGISASSEEYSYMPSGDGDTNRIANVQTSIEAGGFTRVDYQILIIDKPHLSTAEFRANGMTLLQLTETLTPIPPGCCGSVLSPIDLDEAFTTFRAVTLRLEGILPGRTQTESLDLLLTPAGTSNTGIPNAPSNLSLLPLSPSSVRLSWIDNAVGVATADSFVAEHESTAFAGTVEIATGNTTEAAAKQLVVPGLAPALHTFRVRARNELGSSPASGDATVDLSQACEPTATTMCLESDRFEVSGTIVGTAGEVPLQMEELTADTGYSWFLNSQNLEVFVKVLDACSSNGHYWVFFGGLTTLEADLRVRDTLTGQVLAKHNPARTNFQTEANTSFFDGCFSGATRRPAHTEPADLGRRGPQDTAHSGRLREKQPARPEGETTGPSPCIVSNTAMCLENGQFEVSGSIVGNQGSVPLQMVGLTADTGFSWFLNPDNLEVFIKVLNGCGVNRRYWVFFGGLTTLRTEIRVRSTITGQTSSHTNPAGTPFLTASDVSFFEGCP